MVSGVQTATTRVASHADVLTGSSRNHSSHVRTRDEPLRTFAWEATTRVNEDGIKILFNYPRRDLAQKAKSRGGTLVTRAYINEST